MPVSDPDHARYGQHLSLDEVNELVKPNDESAALVREWLHEHVSPHAIQSSPAGDFLSFTLPVAKVEKLLDTKYSVYRHTDGSRLVRAPQWKLPFHLHKHVATVQPTTAFFRTVPQSKTYNLVSTEGEEPKSSQAVENPTVETACDPSGVTPLCLRTLYET